MGGRTAHSTRDLAGVAHDIAHHARSGLACLYPHLGQQCAAAHVASVRVDLLSSVPYPAELPMHGPLAMALRSLRDRLIEMLALRGHDIDGLSAAELTFSFPPEPRDHSVYSVRACLTTSTGRRYDRTLE